LKILIALFLVVSVYAKTIPVHISAYTSHKNQTSKHPFTAAWGLKLKKHHKKKIIAVSRDLLKKYKLKPGQKVYLKTKNFKGYVRVQDKMNKRWRRKVDLYFYTARNEALRFGVRKGTITIR
jgi:3D (Asp-Asp-Asp) domain-containing protein